MTLVVSDVEEPVARELNPGMTIGIDLLYFQNIQWQISASGFLLTTAGRGNNRKNIAILPCFDHGHRFFNNTGTFSRASCALSCL